ncbi:hypothetical protein OIU80_01505 [Flavobacterium sp. LS1R47]|uniref:PH domain-containing protein n=1 Tax=Flavobacterium frigoritolerans TaxID=2987686 RepID=A0A9X2YXU2_9FLAO|nr:hypothetical protein [Flavobacterium frigoritolerans]MCV9930948.1 hypothetical protein [Flavobacterium frigoritolerans]
MTLRISFLNQLKMLSDLIFITFVYFFMIYYFLSFDIKLIVYLLIPYFLMFIFPVLWLHFNYLNQTKDVVYEISKNVILKKRGIEILKYNNSDISEITFRLNGSKDTSNGTLAYSKYYYAKIKLLDESFFIITSLYSSKIDTILEENFKDVKITKEKVFYPMI